MALPLANLEHVVAGRAHRVVDRIRHTGAHDDDPTHDDPTHDDPTHDGSPRTSTVRTPTVLQMEAVECGAASLAMVLAYFGRWVPLTEVRRACGVSRDGSKAIHIAKAAREYGLEVHPIRASADVLARTQPPCILWWNYNHFVVFEGYHGERAVLNDPAIGRVEVDPESFARAYTGIALTFATTDGFTTGGKPRRIVRSMVDRTRRMRAGLVLAVVAGLLATIPGLVIPGLTGAFVNDVLEEGNRSTAWWIAGGIAVAALFRVAATVIQQRQLLRVQNALAVTSASKFLWHILRLPLSFFGVRSVSDIALRMDANTVVAQMISGQMATIALSLLTATLYGVVMLFYSWQLALIVFALSATNFLVLRTILKRRETANRALYQDQAKLFATTYGGLRTIETLKATSSEADYFSRWAGQQAGLVNVQNRLASPTVILGAVPTLISALVLGSIVIVGGWQVINDELSIGGLIAFQSLALGFGGPITQIVNTAGTLQDVGSQLQRLDDALVEPLDRAVDGQAHARQGIAGRLSGEVELDSVEFGYASLDPPLISDLDLRIAAGSRVALVGASGAGKSTIVKLISGLLEPWSGSVRFDGVDWADISRDVFAQSFAVVEQRGTLFQGTIRQNLTLWDGTIAERTMIAAARDAQIHDEIVSRPGGYDALIEESGRNWSGGERQRLELARALTRDPSILVLDEATSALDPTTEADVDAAIRRRGITVLIVAHRLSTIRDADEIVVLDHGTVIERGRHEQLLAAGGAYTNLVGSGGDVGE